MTKYVTFQKSLDDLFDAYGVFLGSPNTDTKAHVDECYDLCIAYVNNKTFAKAWRMKLHTIGEFNNKEEAVDYLKNEISNTFISMAGVG